MTALQIIQTEAKKIRENKPNIKYTNAIKMASVKYNAGKLGAAKKAAPKKKASPKLPVKKIVTTVTKEKMSGNRENLILKDFVLAKERLKVNENILKLYKERTKMPFSLLDRALAKKQVLLYSKYVAEIKQHISVVKKFI